MHRISLRLPLVALLCVFSACSGLRAKTAAVNPDAERPLVTPAAIKPDRAANQVVHGAFGERDMTLNCVLSVRNGTVTVVGLTSIGIRAFTIRYDGTSVQVENDLPIPPQLTPERLLADIQLVYWPYAALQSALATKGWKLTEPYSRTRRLRRGDKLIAEVHYDSDDAWAGRSWLSNLEYGYTLGIESTVLAAQ